MKHENPGKAAVFNRQRRLAPALIGAAALVATGAVAEPMLHAPAFYRGADMSRYVDNYVEVGVGYNSHDSYKFGEWNGLREEGAFAILGFNWLSRDRSDGAGYWQATASGLGLETRKFSLGAGRQGVWDLNFSANRLVRSDLDTARFYHDGLGTASLALKPGCGATVADASLIDPTCLAPYRVEQGRDFYRLGFAASLGGGWGLELRYREDVRDGTQTTGLIFSGFSETAIVPLPIDDKTQQVELQASFAADGSQMQVGYHYSHYENRLTHFDVVAPVTGVQVDNRLSLAPSNDFHQLWAAGSLRLGQGSRLTGKLSYGIALQDEAFLPYSVNAPGVALPTTSADGSASASSLHGEVVKTLADIALTTRPDDRSNLKLGYRYENIDNNTPTYNFRYVPRDGTAQGGVDSTSDRYNAPIDTTEHKFVVDGDYRLGASTTLRALVEYAEKDYTLTDRDRTETTKAALDLRRPVFDSFSGSVGYAYTQRRGAPYNKNVFVENTYTAGYVTANGLNAHPSLRSFMYADFSENRLRTSGNLSVSETVSVQGGVEGFEQRFDSDDCSLFASPNQDAFIAGTLPDTCLGRNRLAGASVNLDLQWQPEENFTAFAFANYSESETRQTGRTWSRGAANTSATDTALSWFVTSTNADHAVGLGFKWLPGESGDWNLGAHYAFNQGDGRFNVTGDGAGAVPLPKSTMTGHAFQAYAKWAANRKMTWRANYLYESLESDDFAYTYNDAAIAPPAVTNVLVTGQGSPKYENHVIGISVAVHGW